VQLSQLHYLPLPLPFFALLAELLLALHGRSAMLPE
jgi:hypothetical protein